MRPDEHKKKKNAAYKKKHGIGQTKAQAEDNPGTKKSSSRREAGRHHHTKDQGSVRSKCAGDKSKEQAKSLSDSSGSEAEEAKPVRKTYQRRQIVSNWQKYELQPAEDEKTESRGESFEKLLSMAGDAMAHFRFKDEQEWDDDCCADKTSADQFGQYLSLDTQEIGQSVACLPLYKVLGLSPDIFPDEELKVMENNAAENRKLNKSQQTSQPGCSSQNKETTARDTKPTASVSGSQPYWQHNLNSHKNKAQSTRCSQDKDTLSSKDVSVENVALSPAKVIAKPDSCDAQDLKLSLDDDDLDSLLDAECLKDARMTEKVQVQTQAASSASVTTNVVEQTDFASPLREGKPSQQSTLSTDKLSKDGVDLDDWLDSILDD